jgi:hypothetical protein
MLNPQNILISVAVLLVLLFIYKSVLNPQVMPASSGPPTTCPENWKFEDGLCKPDYETNCMPFDPTKITSKSAGCNIARSCGTVWSGKCA